jgi:hypothetical protein
MPTQACAVCNLATLHTASWHAEQLLAQQVRQHSPSYSHIKVTAVDTYHR